MKLNDELHPGIITLQETFQCDNFVSKLGDYRVLSKEGHFNQRYRGEVAIFIHTSLPYEQLKVNTPLQVIAARVQIEHS